MVLHSLKQAAKPEGREFNMQIQVFRIKINKAQRIQVLANVINTASNNAPSETFPISGGFKNSPNFSWQIHHTQNKVAKMKPKFIVY